MKFNVDKRGACTKLSNPRRVVWVCCRTTEMITEKHNYKLESKTHFKTHIKCVCVCAMEFRIWKCYFI